MQIKKCQWIGKPEEFKIISKNKLNFNSTTTHMLFHTFSEEGKLVLKWENETSAVSLIFLNSKDEFISFTLKENRIEKEAKIASVSEMDFYPYFGEKCFTVVKQDDTLSFYHDDILLCIFKRENIKASVSIGLMAKGVDNITFSFEFNPL